MGRTAIQTRKIKSLRTPSLFKSLNPAMPAGSLRHTQFRSSAPKARYGRPGNSLSLKQSGPLILRRAKGALKLIADVSQAPGRHRLLSGIQIQVI